MYASSDSREKIIGELNATYAKDALGGIYQEYNLVLTWKPNTRITFSIGPDYSVNKDPRQWVGNFDDATSVNTFNTRYVFGKINQHTLSANIRLNWTFSPSLSLQLFMQPFFAVGEYGEFKELAKAKTTDFNIYGSSGSTINYDPAAQLYSVDPDGVGPSQGFSFGNPNFNYKSLRGTAVLRWEILPGSIFYFVWSHNQTNFENPGDFNFARDFKNLWKADGDNILMVKFSYWFNM